MLILLALFRSELTAHGLAQGVELSELDWRPTQSARPF
jgi:hypothetical protein